MNCERPNIRRKMVNRREIPGANSHRRLWNLAALAFLLMVFGFAFLINLPA